ncbi:hypothetical protein CAPTEDRAFT_199852 [Capitella teleta]|uniref:SEA domain-containing protein n=1 Tax=Capitella teleta TaxID=283909 RepID=R7VJN5_CAPTE|nr:hypothetical protein CAPTEDRAFT_199852 [Capitella teleta]|eukprot:ELU16060.1 hypothetical protein CAPTEDRAFT_199852 [Capitella teleta]
MKKLVLLVFAGLFRISLASTENEEIEKNSISVKFYSLTADKWSDKSSGFREVLASAASDECAQNYLSEFSLSNVVIKSSSVEDKYYLSVSYYLTFNPSTPPAVRNVTSYVVNKEALKAISMSARHDLDDVVGKYIVDIGGEEFSPPPDTKYNTIMIPIVFALLIGVIVAAISCYCYSERRKRQTVKRQNDVEGSPKSKVGPAPPPPEAPTNGRPMTAKEKSRTTKKPSNFFRAEEDIQYGVYDECEMPHVTTRAHALPPLTADECETDAESKKRKKKKSKKSKRSKSKDKDDDLEQLQKRSSNVTDSSVGNLSNTASTEL